MILRAINAAVMNSAQIFIAGICSLLCEKPLSAAGGL